MGCRYIYLHENLGVVQSAFQGSHVTLFPDLEISKLFAEKSILAHEKLSMFNKKAAHLHSLCICEIYTLQRLFHDHGKSTMNEDVLKMVIFQCHVSFQGFFAMFAYRFVLQDSAGSSGRLVHDNLKLSVSDLSQSLFFSEQSSAFQYHPCVTYLPS